MTRIFEHSDALLHSLSVNEAAHQVDCRTRVRQVKRQVGARDEFMQQCGFACLASPEDDVYVREPEFLLPGRVRLPLRPAQ